jgi:iron complex transport system permease protein
MSFVKKYILLILLLCILFILDITSGAVFIPINKILACFTNHANVTDTIIVLGLRLPKAIAAICAGSALAVSGMLMQTFFKNPLAGPYVLGVDAVSSLSVALFMLGGGSITNSFFHTLGIPIASSLGALAGLFLIMFIAKKIQNQTHILLIGMMIGFIAGAWQSVLEYLSNAQHLKNFVIWNMASLSNVTNGDLFIFFSVVTVCFVICLFLIKPLNALLLGDEQAYLLGINISVLKNVLLVLTALLSGITTAYCGPIGFVGLALPHLIRIFFKTTHHLHQLLGNILAGACFLLLCDVLSNLPIFEITLPVNVVTSLFGAPFVLWLILKNKNAIS